jgi:hypothetical protein
MHTTPPVPFSSATAANQTSSDIGNTMYVKERELPGNEAVYTSEMPQPVLLPSARHRLPPPPPPPPQETSFNEKWQRKFRDNPFVPIGALATVGALAMGLRAFRGGETRKSQIYMRWRVGAQGATLLALLGGIYYMQYKKTHQHQQQ